MFTNFLSASVSFCYTTGVVYLRGLCQVFQGRDKRRVKSVTGFTQVYGDLIFILVIKNKDMFSSLSC